jgi:hypothetical protein
MRIVVLSTERGESEHAVPPVFRSLTDQVWILSDVMLQWAVGKYWRHSLTICEERGALIAPPPERRSAELVEQFISSSEVARLLGWRTATLRKYRRQGRGPKGYIATGRTRGVYPMQEVIAYQQRLKKGE